MTSCFKYKNIKLVHYICVNTLLYPLTMARTVLDTDVYVSHVKAFLKIQYNNRNKTQETHMGKLFVCKTPKHTTIIVYQQQLLSITVSIVPRTTSNNCPRGLICKI